MNTQNLDKMLRAISLLHGYRLKGELSFEQYFEVIPTETPEHRDRKRAKPSNELQALRARVAPQPTPDRDREQSSSSLAANSKAEAVPLKIRNSSSSAKVVIGEAEKGAAIVYCRYKGVSGNTEADFRDFEKLMGRFSAQKRPLSALKSLTRKLTLNTPKQKREKFKSAFEASPNFNHFQQFLRQQEENASEDDDEDTHEEYVTAGDKEFARIN